MPNNAPDVPGAPGFPKTSLKVEIYFWSRDYHLLFALVALILAAGAAIAFWKQGTQTGSPEEMAWVPGEIRGIEDPWKVLQEELAPFTTEPAARGRERTERAAFLLMALGPQPPSEHGGPRVHALLAASPLPAARRQLLEAFWNSLASLAEEPNAMLLTLAYRQQLDMANYLAAWLYARQENEARALFFLGREAEFPASARARHLVIAMLRGRNNFAGLEKIADDPLYRAEWSPAADAEVAVHRGQWLRAAADVAQMIWSGIDGQLAALVLLSGGIWFALWLQAVQVLEAPLPRAALCTAAFCLGALAVIPTLLLACWSEGRFGLTEGNGLAGDFLFFMAGVGPREEFCKLLAFLPLVPWLLRRGNRLEMLMAAGFAGLGFAVVENVQYFSMHAASAYGRFLTANFLHVAATGLAGAALCEALGDLRRKGWVFPAVFLWVCFLHGAYDLFLASPALRFAQGVSSLCFVWLALAFFKRLRLARSLETNYLWMPAGIVLGLAVLGAATLVCTAAATGFTPALHLLAYQALSLAMMVYLFVWQTGSLRYDTKP